MRGFLIKDFTPAEILSYRDVWFDMNGIHVSFHTLAQEGWKFRIKRKTAVSSLRIGVWHKMHMDTRHSCLSFRIKKLAPTCHITTEGLMLYDWAGFFEKLQNELIYTDNYASFSTKVSFTSSVPVAHDISKFSSEELLSELAVRYPKPRRKSLLAPDNVIDIKGVLERLHTLQQQERLRA